MTHVVRKQSSELPETPDLLGAFPRLSVERMRTMITLGELRRTHRGEMVIEEGAPINEFFLILSGKVAVIEGSGPDARIVRVHGPGRFLGELGLLAGQPAFASCVVAEPGAVLAVPVERLFALVAEDAALGDLILRAYLVRRSLLIDDGAGFRIIGSCYSPDTRRLREFAARNRLPHRWIDLDSDGQAETLLRRFGIPPEDTPVVIWGGKVVLRCPADVELARLIGLPAAPELAGCDLLVVGAGPAGLAAAVYAASEGLDTVVVDAIAAGGQAGRSPRIENYLGFPSGISGADLAVRATMQVRRFGARITVPAAATALASDGGNYRLRLEDGTELTARTVLIATGARYRRLDLPRREHFDGTSIFYAATEMEIVRCRADPVVVVGGGNAAGQATLCLARRVPQVYLVSRTALPQNMSRYLIDEVRRHQRVEILEHHEPRELLGDEYLSGVVVANNRSDEQRSLVARALFSFIGVEPGTEWLVGTLALDPHGFVLTGQDVPAAGRRRRPLMLETSQPGVFAIGDVRCGSTKRVAAAVGEGAMAIRVIHEHLQQIGHKTPRADLAPGHI
jgi:thioredoxin reductase (NADPH)